MSAVFLWMVANYFKDVDEADFDSFVKEKRQQEDFFCGDFRPKQDAKFESRYSDLEVYVGNGWVELLELKDKNGEQEGDK